MRKRFLNLTLALGLVVGLLAGAVGSAGAVTTANSNVEWLFYPWVPNGENLDGSDNWFGSVTIQNLENYKVRIDFSNTAGGNIATGDWTTLEPHASKTFSAGNLGLPDGGAGVAVRASWYFDTNGGVKPGDDICPSSERQVTEVVTRGNTADGQDKLSTQGILSIDSVEAAQANGNPADPATTYAANSDYVYTNGSISWAPAGAEPSAGAKYRVTMTVQDCNRAPQIGGIEKQVSVGNNSFLTNTTNSSIKSVDGYTAIPDEDVAWGPSSSFCHDVYGDLCNNIGWAAGGYHDGISYLPIVQTNNGWNSILHITNIDASSPNHANVTVRFFKSGGETIAGDSTYSWTGSVNKGGTVKLDLKKDMGIPDEWVGSAEISSDYGVVTNVSRVKNRTDMLLTNTAAPSWDSATSISQVGTGFELYAPLIFKHYNGWNTGINIVNIAEQSNTVQVQFHGPTNNVMFGGTVTLAPKESKFIYIPSSGDAGLTDEFHGAAVLSGTAPFHASIDEVKYTGNGQDVGEAMSYIATYAAAQRAWGLQLADFSPTGTGPSLSLPLVQKGSQATGKGDTSGIDLFNASASRPVTAEIMFYWPNGTPSTVSIPGPLQLTLGALQTATVYTMNASGGVIGLGNMETNFQGSAQIKPVDGRGVLVGVSNNVNYGVSGDGSAVYNLYNSWGQFRFPCSQTFGCPVSSPSPSPSGTPQ